MSNNSTSSLKHENMEPSLFNLPALPPSLSESLTSGTSIPAPPPSPPPPKFIPIVTPEKRKSSLRRSITPPATPITGPSPSMPGAFPVSPTSSPKPQPQTAQTFSKATYTTSAYASSPIPFSPSTPNSKSSKRPSSFRNLLSFKRAHPASPESPSSPISPRPASAGGSSLASSIRPGLNGRKSGSFWTRRKSSLSMYTNGTGQGSLPSPEPNGHDTVIENNAEHKKLVSSSDGTSPSLNRIRSTTFWRRKSSLALSTDGEQKQKQYPDQGANEHNTPPTTPQQEPPIDPVESPILEHRSWSPPPTLPDVVVLKDLGVLDPDDMFGSIG